MVELVGRAVAVLVLAGQGMAGTPMAMLEFGALVGGARAAASVGSVYLAVGTASDPVYGEALIKKWRQHY